MAAPHSVLFPTSGLTPSGSSEPSKKSLLDNTIVKVAFSALSVVGSSYLYYMSMLNPYAGLGLLLANVVLWLKKEPNTDATSTAGDKDQERTPSPAAAPGATTGSTDESDPETELPVDTDYASASPVSNSPNLSVNSNGAFAPQTDATDQQPLSLHSNQTSSSQPNSARMEDPTVQRMQSASSVLRPSGDIPNARQPVTNLVSSDAESSDEDDPDAAVNYGTHGRNQSKLRKENPVNLAHLQQTIENTTSLSSEVAGAPAGTLAASQLSLELDPEDVNALEEAMGSDNDELPNLTYSHSRNSSTPSTSTAGPTVQLSPEALSALSSSTRNSEPATTDTSPRWPSENTATPRRSEDADSKTRTKGTTAADKSTKEKKPTRVGRFLRRNPKKKPAPGNNNS